MSYKQRYFDLANAVEALYYAAYWHADRKVDEAALWTAVRDLANIAPGYTSARLGPDQSARPEVGTPLPLLKAILDEFRRWKRCQNIGTCRQCVDDSLILQLSLHVEQLQRGPQARSTNE